ncbi:GerAB/ArcD/ProY family transporter [Paenibacillus piri]|uniref:Spore gernimation protein n=1 Tax=Paenibacillus piri TaxID=2547395 RepID=A0A4R5KQW7_9BACL|nr:endospore germination permease [Paenibacillus piri]TDF97976.1 spore gernimation protein [Paenibacillus piri]
MKHNGVQETDSSNTITVRQSSWLTASTIIGVGVLTLPRSSVHFARESGWIATIIGALLSMAAMYIITVLAKRFPYQSLVEYTASIMGSSKHPVIGWILSLPFLVPYYIYWVLSTAIIARIFGEVVVTTVLPKTPLEVIIASMLLVSFVLTLYDVEVVARVNEILFVIIVIPVLVIALSSYQSANWDNLFPLFNVSWFNFLKGVASSATSYLGFEVMIMFLAFANTTQKVMKANLWGIAIPGIVYTLIVISGTAVFGVDELDLLAWPTLELVKTTQVPGLILERVESAFLGVWVAAVFTSVGNTYYVSSLLVRQMFHLKGHRLIAFIHLPLYYWLALRPPNTAKLFQYSNYMGYFGGAIAFIIPAVLLVLAVIRKKGSKRKNPQAATSPQINLGGGKE